MNVRIPIGNISQHNAKMLEKERLAKSQIKKKEIKNFTKRIAVYCRFATKEQTINPMEEKIKKVNI